jgi:hypothetical protein
MLLPRRPIPDYACRPSAMAILILLKTHAGNDGLYLMGSMSVEDH